ncbi:MAG: fused MFS/spermidine synthase [Thermodesulfobacteriota bacterium]
MNKFFAGKIGPLVVWFFFLSGAASLMYEIIWMRMLTVYAGGSDFSVSIVLAVFMAGLAMGSAIAGRLADCLDGSRRLLIYGWLKLAIGLYGLLFPLLMSWCKPLYALFYHHLLDHFLGYNAASSLISALLLIVPTTLMGITFPLLCRFVIDDLPQAGSLMGRLYGAETLGAATGTLLCGFWLIGGQGITAALTAAVMIHAAIGLFCILFLVPAIRLKTGKDARTPSPAAADRTTGRENFSNHRLLLTHVIPLYALLGISAFCGMAYEVIWTKLIALLLGPTTYSFTIVLFTFITGLALGSIFFGRLADRSRNPFSLLVATQFAAAGSVLVVSHFLGNAQIFFAKILYQLRDHFFLLETAKTGLLFVLMVVPTVFLGASFPVAVRIRTRSLASLGESVGKLYAVSTVGAFLGSFSAGFVLVPLLGKAMGLSTLAGAQVVTAMTASMLAGRRLSLRVVPAVLAATLLAGCLFLPRWDRASLTRGKYLRPDLYGDALENMSLMDSLFLGRKRLSHLCTDQDILWIEDGIGGLVAVGRTVNSLGATIMFLSVNGKIVTSTQWDLHMMTIAGHLPMMFHRNAKSALVIGLGGGITAGEMLHYPLETLDVVEISPEVVAACPLFAPFHNNLLTDPRTHLIVQDARTHVALTDRRYDVIVSDPINPWVAGSAQLFTLDHFRRVKSRLNPDGIFIQWFHAYQSGWDVFSMFGRTFREAFPNSLLVNTAIFGPDYLFVGFADDHQPMPGLDILEQNLPYAVQSANLRMPSASVLYPLIVTDSPASLFGDGRLHTDAHPYMEYLAPRYAYTGGIDFTKQVREGRQRSPLLRSILSRFGDIDHQLDFAEFMASVNVPPFGLVQTANASPSQMTRYRHIVENYCRVNKVEDYSRLSPLDRGICLPLQEQLVLERIDQLITAGNDSWLLAEAYFDLAGIYAAGNGFRRATTAYRQGLLHLPDHQAALSNLAACHERLGEHRQAIDALNRLVLIRPRSAGLMARLAVNYLRLGNPGEALASVEKGLTIDPASNALLSLRNALTGRDPE